MRSSPSSSASPRDLLPELSAVPGGTFLMGSETGRSDERPVHRVTLRPFLLARTPVTNAQYALYVAESGTPPRFWDDPRFNAPKQPVVAVSWEEAVAYCRWLSARTGLPLRLPTEAEWEWAARGAHPDASPRYPWGDEPPEAAPGLSLAHLPMDRPAAADTGPANPLGLLGLGWNVHEWCSDWYDPAYYAVSPEFDPRGPAVGERKASRGGAWRHQVKVSRCAQRSAIPPHFRYNDYSFRLAADA
jgi:sulfatase modifying factor 1